MDSLIKNISEKNMKNPSKTEMIVAFCLIVGCMFTLSMFGLTMERCGYYTIGISVGIIFSMFGVSAHKSLKNTLMIMGTSFVCSMIYDVVGHVLKILI